MIKMKTVKVFTFDILNAVDLKFTLCNHLGHAGCCWDHYWVCCACDGASKAPVYLSVLCEGCGLSPSLITCYISWAWETHTYTHDVLVRLLGSPSGCQQLTWTIEPNQPLCGSCIRNVNIQLLCFPVILFHIHVQETDTCWDYEWTIDGIQVVKHESSKGQARLSYLIIKVYSFKMYKNWEWVFTVVVEIFVGNLLKSILNRRGGNTQTKNVRQRGKQ